VRAVRLQHFPDAEGTLCLVLDIRDFDELGGMCGWEYRPERSYVPQSCPPVGARPRNSSLILIIVIAIVITRSPARSAPYSKSFRSVIAQS
jgi:hypothetical protein